jgi:signal transduction histidine kinase
MLLIVSTTAPMPTRTRWSRDLLFHLGGIATSTFALAFWITGVVTSLSMAITYFGLVVALGTLLVCRWFARLERRRAGIVLGAPIPERYPRLQHARWTARLYALMGDRTIWRDFAWTGLSGIVGMTLSVVAVSLWGAVLQLVTLPVWYWAVPGGSDFGIVQVDTLPLALAAALVGLALAPIAGYLGRALTIAEIAFMRWLLAPRPVHDEALAASTDDRPRSDQPLALPLAMHVSLSLLIGLVVTLIWGATGLGYFWPIWVWLGLALLVALDLVTLRGQAAAPGPRRRLQVHAELTATVAALLVILWLLTGMVRFWPFWSLLGLGVALAVHAMVVHRDRLPLRAREQELAERVDVLTRTRKGALDVQAAELRRIERDLHDGAQARLVSLSMQLGRAEERVADQPEVAALLRRAREDAGAAIAELRDLARGIAPPILADRGLAAAVQALTRRVPVPVTVDADPGLRLLPVVETAAYFVAAEALTNVAKHGGGAGARVVVRRVDDQLVVEVADDGPGGADPGGGGLTGLRHRVEALDGTLTVTSPAGGGTTVRAELPCGP